MKLAHSKFPRLFSDDDGRLLPLRQGQTVTRYTGPATAVVENGDSRSLVDSTIALRARDEDGELRPVDVDLRPADGGWEPANSDISVSFGQRSSRALSFASDFTVAPAGADIAGSRVANEVFYPGVARDTDAWFGPTATGARVAYQLRSAESPEEVRLTVTAAEGATLSTAPAGGPGGVEIVHSGERIGSVSPPVAFDAEGEPVDVAMRAEGEDIVISVPHRDRDLLYPLVVDPVFENQDSWKYGNTNTAGWKTNQYQVPFDFWFGDIGLGNGFGVGRRTNVWHPMTAFGEWQYQSPTDRSYIHRADFIHPGHWADVTTHRFGMWSIYWGGFQHSWATTAGYNWPDTYLSICADGAATVPACDENVNYDQSHFNYVLSSLSPYQNGSWANGAFNHFGGARIWMSDMDLPELWYWMDAPTGWVRETPAGPYNGVNEAHVRIGDPGLGMWGLWMDVPGKPRQYSASWGGCNGAHSSRCPDSRAHNFSYAGMSEGIQTVTVTGQDVLGKTRSFSKTLKIDRTAPAIEVEGPFRPTDTQWVEGGEQGISIDATDPLSGVSKVELRIDGAVAHSASQSCDGPCGSAEEDFVVDTATLSEGQHQVAAIATDGAGNAATVNWTVRVERTAPTLSLSGTLKAAEGQTLVDGVDYTLVADSSDNSGPVSQAGVRSLAMSVDDDYVDIVSQPGVCTSGGCSMSHTFTYRPEDYESGLRRIQVTATDFAGNVTAQTFTVTNPDPAPATCASAPVPAFVPNPDPMTPAMAQALLESPQGFAPALAANSSVLLDGHGIQPRLNGSNPAKFFGTELVPEFDAEADRQAADGVTTSVSDRVTALCVSPTTVATGASQPSGPFNQSAALYANSHPATDTVIRATAVGMKSFYQLRTARAPLEFALHVALQPGQRLTLLPSGSAAVVETLAFPARPVGVPAPAEPTLAQRKQAVTDTDLHLRLANTDLVRAQAQTADPIVAVIPKPWAQDAQQRAVGTALTVAGSTLTVRVDHAVPGTAYPVIADPEVVTADAVDEAEAGRASDDTAQYSDAELDAFGAAPGPVPPAPPSSSPSTTEFDDDPYNEPVDGSAFSHEGVDEGAAGNPQASAAVTTLSQASRDKLAALDIGLTESDPSTLGTYDELSRTTQVNPRFASLNPQRLRPLVPYNVVDLLDDEDPNLRRRARMWDDWFKRARGLGRKADVTITRDLDIHSGGRAPTIAEYRAGLTAFLEKYGSVVQNLTPWNEPNMRRDPLWNNPRRAARYWIHARQLCHPKGMAKRCGHVVAGEYAGIIAKAERKRGLIRYAGKRWYYPTLYHRYLRTRGKQPTVWGFHAYGDTEEFALLGKRKPLIIDRFHRLFSQANYQPTAGQSARIWLSAIGSPYTYLCGSLSNARQIAFCNEVNEDRDRVLWLGMRRQRDTLAFILGQIATRYRGITRLYYFPMHNTRGIEYADIGPNQHSGRCNRPPQDATKPYCARDDWGIVGADHDGTVQYAQQLPGASGRSSPGQTRLAFCLLRERRPQWVSRPNRLKTCNPPAAPPPGSD